MSRIACRWVAVLTLCTLLAAMPGCNAQRLPRVEGAVVVSPDGLTGIVESSRTMSEGADWWRIQSIFTDPQGRTIVVVRCYAYLWVFRVDDNGCRLTASVDLRKVNATYTQGTILPDFIISHDGRYLVINNGLYDDIDQDSPVYLVDLFEGHTTEIGRENGALAIEAWSPTANTYAYVNRKENRLTVHEQQRGRTSVVTLDIGPVTGLVLCDDESVMVSTDTGNYNLSRDSRYRPQPFRIDGEILGCTALGEIRVLHKGVIQAISKDSRERLVAKVPYGAKVVRRNEAHTILSTGYETWILTADDVITQYEFGYYPTTEVLFSPNGKRYLTTDSSGLWLRGPDDKMGDLLDNEFMGLGTRIRWLDNCHILRIEGNGSKLAMRLVKESVLDGSREVLFGQQITTGR